MPKVSTLKQNSEFFFCFQRERKLVREGNLDDRFSHENQNFPAAIAHQEK